MEYNFQGTVLDHFNWSVDFIGDEVKLSQPTKEKLDRLISSGGLCNTMRFRVNDQSFSVCSNSWKIQLMMSTCAQIANAIIEDFLQRFVTYLTGECRIFSKRIETADGVAYSFYAGVEISSNKIQSVTFYTGKYIDNALVKNYYKNDTVVCNKDISNNLRKTVAAELLITFGVDLKLATSIADEVYQAFQNKERDLRQSSDFVSIRLPDSEELIGITFNFPRELFNLFQSSDLPAEAFLMRYKGVTFTFITKDERKVLFEKLDQNPLTVFGMENGDSLWLQICKFLENYKCNKLTKLYKLHNQIVKALENMSTNFPSNIIEEAQLSELKAEFEKVYAS
jgi:hypothetical protein